MKLSVLLFATATILLIVNTAYINAYPLDKQDEGESNNPGTNNSAGKSNSHPNNDTPIPDMDDASSRMNGQISDPQPSFNTMKWRF
ncbi:hypothetical protein BDF19DRAFT_438360 [Syncephalis fuscata]|nr:hypothetical protein BDF19DRAFT_438360 [Syncephalis fuscata]